MRVSGLSSECGDLISCTKHLTHCYKSSGSPFNALLKKLSQKGRASFLYFYYIVTSMRGIVNRAGIFKQYMGARNQVGIPPGYIGWRN